MSAENTPQRSELDLAILNRDFARAVKLIGSGHKPNQAFLEECRQSDAFQPALDAYLVSFLSKNDAGDYSYLIMDLLGIGANPNVTLEDGERAIDSLIFGGGGQANAVQALLHYGAVPTKPEALNKLLVEAITRGLEANLSYIDQLLRLGADPNLIITSDNGLTAAHKFVVDLEASYKHLWNHHTLDRLPQFPAGPLPNRLPNGKSAIDYAISILRFDIAATLLKHKANPPTPEIVNKAIGDDIKRFKGQNLAFLLTLVPAEAKEGAETISKEEWEAIIKLKNAIERITKVHTVAHYIDRFLQNSNQATLKSLKQSLAAWAKLESLNPNQGLMKLLMPLIAQLEKRDPAPHVVELPAPQPQPQETAKNAESEEDEKVSVQEDALQKTIEEQKNLLRETLFDPHVDKSQKSALIELFQSMSLHEQALDNILSEAQNTYNFFAGDVLETLFRQAKSRAVPQQAPAPRLPEAPAQSLTTPAALAASPQPAPQEEVKNAEVERLISSLDKFDSMLSRQPRFDCATVNAALIQIAKSDTIKNKTQKIKELLARHPEEKINVLDQNNLGAIDYLIQKEDFESAELLSKRGAVINRPISNVTLAKALADKHFYLVEQILLRPYVATEPTQRPIAPDIQKILETLLDNLTEIQFVPSRPEAVYKHIESLLADIPISESRNACLKRSLERAIKQKDYRLIKMLHSQGASIDQSLLNTHIAKHQQLRLSDTQKAPIDRTFIDLLPEITTSAPESITRKEWEIVIKLSFRMYEEDYYLYLSPEFSAYTKFLSSPNRANFENLKEKLLIDAAKAPDADRLSFLNEGGLRTEGPCYLIPSSFYDDTYGHPQPKITSFNHLLVTQIKTGNLDELRDSADLLAILVQSLLKESKSLVFKPDDAPAWIPNAIKIAFKSGRMDLIGQLFECCANNPKNKYLKDIVLRGWNEAVRERYGYFQEVYHLNFKSLDITLPRQIPNFMTFKECTDILATIKINLHEIDTVLRCHLTEEIKRYREDSREGALQRLAVLYTARDMYSQCQDKFSMVHKVTIDSLITKMEQSLGMAPSQAAAEPEEAKAGINLLSRLMAGNAPTSAAEKKKEETPKPPAGSWWRRSNPLAETVSRTVEAPNPQPPQESSNASDEDSSEPFFEAPRGVTLVGDDGYQKLN